MKLLLRVVLFVVLFAALAFASLYLVGLYNGMQAHAAIADPVAAREAARQGSEQFFFHHAPLLLASVTLVSALIAFGLRNISILISGCLAIAAFFFFRIGVTAYQTRHNQVAPEIVRLPSDKSAASSAQQRAIQQFPQLGVAGSPLNREFVRRYRDYQSGNPQYFEDPEWPTKLAKESNDALSH